MKTQQLLAMMFAGTLFFTACKKSDNPAPENTIRSSRDFIEKAGPQTQSFTINTADLPKTINLKGGISIKIPAGAFKKNGAVITGPVTIEAIELLKRSQLVMAGVNTNHISGMPLQSDGSFFLDVKVNGESVDRFLNVPVEIAVPTKRDGFTQLWIGNDAVQENQFAWQQPAQGAQREVKVTNENFIFNFGELGWVNCDIFYASANPKTTMRISVPNNPGQMASFRAMTGETFVFFVAKGDNVVAQLYTPDGVNQVMSYENTMPMGVEGRLISFAVKDGKFWFAKKDITITENQTESLTLTESTEDAVQAEITALDNF